MDLFFFFKISVVAKLLLSMRKTRGLAKIPNKPSSNVLFIKVTERFEGLINQTSISDYFLTVVSTINKYFPMVGCCNVRFPARASTKSFG